jgi:hypothetical protein
MNGFRHLPQPSWPARPGHPVRHSGDVSDFAPPRPIFFPQDTRTGPGGPVDLPIKSGECHDGEKSTARRSPDSPVTLATP